MTTTRESLERIAIALERLVALEERKVQGAKKVLNIAARQQRELDGRPNLELTKPYDKPGPA